MSDPTKAQSSSTHLRDLAAIALAVVATVTALSVAFSERKTNFEEVGLGPDTVSYYASRDGYPIHCQGVLDAADCLAGFAARGSRRAALWLGNSQLHGINQKAPDDESAPALLFPRLQSEGIDLLAFSQPNANLQEHYVLFTWLRQRLPLELLVLPVVFDDLRESGIRFNVAPALADAKVVAALEERGVGRTIIANASNLAAGELAGIRETVQERVEERLTHWLEGHWAFWANRVEARGVFFLSLWRLRNSILRITPQSTRRVLPGRYELNIAALEAILGDARAEGVEVRLYVVPIRNDIAIPYEVDSYAKFKSEIEALAVEHGATALNLEGLVPARFWGAQLGTMVGHDEEVDFMHFQGQGHRLLATAIGDTLERWLGRSDS